jgi:hypothetical protein
MPPRRVNVTLDQEYAVKLSRLAERAHVSDGTLARSLLTSALDEADPDPAGVTEILDAIPGAFEDAELGRRQAEQGQTIDLEDL